jgi:hypothetical protein
MVTTTAARRIRLGMMYAAPLPGPVGRSPHIGVGRPAVDEDDGLPEAQSLYDIVMPSLVVTVPVPTGYESPFSHRSSCETHMRSPLAQR